MYRGVAHLCTAVQNLCVPIYGTADYRALVSLNTTLWYMCASRCRAYMYRDVVPVCTYAASD